MKKKFLCIVFFSISLLTFSQYQKQEIDSLFTNYTSDYQEIVYSHLNKSKYIVGEMIGFTAYIFDKKTKKLSPITKNLYCTISNEKDSIVASKLFKVEDGIVDGYFMINSSIKSGTYTFRSFTNWMRNFSQNNYHSEKIQIIDSEVVYNSKKEEKSFDIDVQFLPESGHLLEGVINVMGVVIKDEMGFGIPNSSGKIYDDNNNYITSFKVNKNGIGRFSFTPVSNRTYTAEINNRNKKISLKINEPIEKKGVLIQVSRNSENIIISAVSNTQTNLKKPYKLTLQNGKDIQVLKLDFNENNISTKKIPLKNLPSGINIITLFNSENLPISERMFFNYEKITVLKSKEITSIEEKDSTTVFLEFPKNLGINTVSVSVLPATTKAYEKHTNIVSKLFLEPYVKGFIEKADHYFTDISKEKIQDLDNLLITQGWSSYDWNAIFTKNIDRIYEFENGIDINVNLFKKEEKSSYLIHHLSENDAKMIDFDEKIKSFKSNGYFPFDNEKLNISKVNKKGGLERPSLYVQFSINTVPNFITSNKNLLQTKNFFTEENFVDFQNFQKLNKSEELKGIVLKVNLEEKRRDSIRKRTWGDLYFPEKKDEGMLLSYFLDAKPSLLAYDNFQSGSLYVLNTIADAIPAIFVDDLQLIDYSQLFLYPMIDVDFIEINLSSIEGGTRFRGGVIKIKTNPYVKKNKKKTVREIEFPITFTKPKRFYIPKYESYKDPIFKQFGVIDWFATKNINEDGTLQLTFDNKNQKNITLFFQGVTKEGKFIMEEKTFKSK